MPFSPAAGFQGRPRAAGMISSSVCFCKKNFLQQAPRKSPTVDMRLSGVLSSVTQRDGLKKKPVRQEISADAALL